jgi:hypothetical protein
MTRDSESLLCDGVNGQTAYVGGLLLDIRFADVDCACRNLRKADDRPAELDING